MRTDAKLSKAAVNDKQLYTLFQEFDVDGSGSISCDEFIAWVQPNASTPTNSPRRKPKTTKSPSSSPKRQRRNVNKSNKSNKSNNFKHKAATTKAAVNTSAVSNNNTHNHKRWNSVVINSLTAGTSFSSLSSPVPLTTEQQPTINGSTTPNASSLPLPIAKRYTPTLEWLRLSRTLHLELIEQCRPDATESEVTTMLQILKQAGVGYLREEELILHVRQWCQSSPTRNSYGEVVRRVHVGILKFREMLLKRGTTVTDLALECGMLMREHNRTLLDGYGAGAGVQSNKGASTLHITPEWLSVVERTFIHLDTAGHGILTFLELNALSLSLLLFSHHREQQQQQQQQQQRRRKRGGKDSSRNVMSSNNSIDVDLLVSKRALSLMREFGADKRGMVTLRKFKTVLYTRGFTLLELDSLEHVVRGFVDMWSHGAYGFPLPSRLWDTSASVSGSVNGEVDDVTVFYLLEGPRLLYEYKQSLSISEQSTSTAGEEMVDTATSIAAKIWSTYVALEPASFNAASGDNGTSEDSMVRDGRPFRILEYVTKYMNLNARTLDTFLFARNGSGNDGDEGEGVEVYVPDAWTLLLGRPSSTTMPQRVALLDAAVPYMMTSAFSMTEDHLERNDERSSAAQRRRSGTSSPISVPPRLMFVDEPKAVDNGENSSDIGGSSGSSGSSGSNGGSSNGGNKISTAVMSSVPQSTTHKWSTPLALPKTTLHEDNLWEEMTVSNMLDAFSVGADEHLTRKQNTSVVPVASSPDSVSIVRQQQTMKQLAFHITSPRIMHDEHRDRMDEYLSVNATVNPTTAPSTATVNRPVPPPLKLTSTNHTAHSSPRLSPSTNHATATISSVTTSARSPSRLPKSIPKGFTSPALSKYTRDLESLMKDLPTSNGKRVLKVGDLLKKGSGNRTPGSAASLVGVRNWKKRFMVLTVHLPTTSTDKFDPFCALTYYPAATSQAVTNDSVDTTTQAAHGVLYLDRHSYHRGDHHPSGYRKDGKYEHMFTIGRSTSDQEGALVSPLNLIDVVPYDDAGRPLALRHGYPGIRYDLTLRSHDEHNKVEWMDAIDRGIRICHVFQRIIDLVSSKKLRTRSVATMGSRGSGSGSESGKKRRTQGIRQNKQNNYKSNDQNIALKTISMAQHRGVGEDMKEVSASNIPTVHLDLPSNTTGAAQYSADQGDNSSTGDDGGDDAVLHLLQVLRSMRGDAPPPSGGGGVGVRESFLPVEKLNDNEVHFVDDWRGREDSTIIETDDDLMGEDGDGDGNGNGEEEWSTPQMEDMESALTRRTPSESSDSNSAWSSSAKSDARSDAWKNTRKVPISSISLVGSSPTKIVFGRRMSTIVDDKVREKANPTFGTTAFDKRMEKYAGSSSSSSKNKERKNQHTALARRAGSSSEKRKSPPKGIAQRIQHVPHRNDAEVRRWDRRPFS